MYWRLRQNPNYYNLTNTSGEDINDYLSEMIENTIEELENAKCIAVEEEMDLAPLNLGIIGSYYYIKHNTIEHLSTSLKEGTKLKNLISIISAAPEFENVPIREGEENILKILCSELHYKILRPKLNDPATKVNILL